MVSEAPSSPSEDELLAELRRQFREAQLAESRPDRARYLSALKAVLATAEEHAKDLAASGSEVGPMLSEVALAFSKTSHPELARRAVDLGLEFAPGSSALLHHKALLLLAQNRDLPEARQLVDKALEANPNDKAIWATRGDILRLQGQAAESVDAYLHAQQLDAASSQYVDRALKVAPHDPKALRTKLELARALGGDVRALAACDELLASNPEDLDLLFARAELLAALGRGADALEPIQRVRSARPDDARASLFLARLLFNLKRGPEAQAVAKPLIESPNLVEGGAVEELARLAEAETPEFALAARERLRETDPRNLQNLLDLKALALRLGRPEAALGACRAMLDAQPRNLEAMRGLAEVEFGEGHFDAALTAYRELLAAHPHALSEARKALEAAREANRPEYVREFSEAILAEDPNDLPAQLGLARSLSGSGDAPGALKAYDSLLAAHPGELPYLLEKREVVARSNDPSQLAPVLDELFRLDPTRVDVAIERGNLYLSIAYDQAEGSSERDRAARTALVSYERASSDADAVDVAELGIARASRLINDHDRAIHAYQSFLAREPNHLRLDILKELGHALRETGRYSEASDAYGRAITGGLEDTDLFWGSVEVLALLNQDARALQLIDLLLRREPSNPQFLRKRGQLLLRGGRRTDALTTLQQAVQAAHGDPHSYFEVAEALRSQGAYADALTYYRQGLAIEPTNRHGRLALAETLQLAGQYSEVLTIVDPLLTEEPNDLASWKVRGDALRALGRPNEVLYSLRAILLLEPDNAPALLEQYRLHSESKEGKEAYETLTRLLQTNAPEAQDATLHLEHGDLAAGLGLTEEANASYERAAQIDPAYRTEIALRRARLRLTAGRPDLALEVLDEGLKAAPPGAPPNLGALLLRAEILGALERPAEARAAYEEVRQRDPKSPVALAGIARSMLDAGQHAEAAEFLAGAIPQAAPQESLYLLLAEAESGLGHLDRAGDAVRKGVEVLPKSKALWVKAGELAIARQAWPEAASGFAHALALDPTSVEVLLKAGFVAQKLEHPNESLALYERATEADPKNTGAWTSRGLALIATGRPADAIASFDRALALDSDYTPAKDGKKVATQRTRDAEVQRYGREALLLEARLNRTVTKNDLFVTLHVPYEFLDAVLAAIGRTVKINLDRLDTTEVKDLESASYHLITAALDHRPPGIERRGFTLADVAVLSPPSHSLDQTERLFSYLKAVLEADLRPENLSLTPDVEELARHALVLPEEQRTLFQLVKNLRVGIYKARLIKVVEEAGTAVHAPLPSLDLGAYSPEFRAGESAGSEAELPTLAAPAASAPAAVPAGGGELETMPPPSGAEWSSTLSSPTPAATLSHGGGGPARCVGCGGIASVYHACSAPLCQHCIGQFPNCPKCGQPISTMSTRAISGVVVTTPRGRSTARSGGALGGLKGVFQRTKTTPPKPESAPRPAAPKAEGPAKASAAKPEHSPKPAAHPTADHARPREAPAGSPPARKEPTSPASKSAPALPSKPAEESDAESSAPGTHPKREKKDDEPRL
jgi:tetratricopeptide (TPR) repeat protein